MRSYFQFPLALAKITLLVLPLFIMSGIVYTIISTETLKLSILQNAYPILPLLAFLSMAFVLFNYNFWLGFFSQDKFEKKDKYLVREYESRKQSEMLKLKQENEIDTAKMKLELDHRKEALRIEKEQFVIEREKKALELKRQAELQKLEVTALKEKEKGLRLRLESLELETRIAQVQRELMAIRKERDY